MTRQIAAGLVPLFDRLAGNEQIAIDGVLLDARGLLASLLRDLSRLLNTRNGRSIDSYLSEDLGVLDYGLPDISILWPASKVDRDRLAAVIEKALEAYEPRLRAPRIEVTEDPVSPSRACVALVSNVLLEQQERRVEFELSVDAGSRSVEVGA